ncbi:AraC family transcriptional regulator [Faecalicatena sp. AGMB00832]|uniref:AraC family transcriptional regulator n=2 Tax=Faecalicatena faecalis TaxID=2726362 RepID=A0ABS6D169_9FIRM|nr:AraC family transcriptional regulator [Faecalicatena faecalis]
MEQYRHEFIDKNEMLDLHLDFFIDPGQTVINKHFHDWIEIIYLTHGDLEIQVNNKTTQLKVNDFVVINPMSIHSTRCMGGNTAILLQIPISFLEKFMPDIRDYSFCVDLESKDPKVQTKLANIRSTLQDLWINYEFQVEGYVFRCYSLIFEIIYILVHSFSYKVDRKERQKNEKNLERIQTIIEYVEEHYQEPISIPEIAGLVGLNEIYFSRFFKNNMGMTFLEYLNMVRLEKIYVDLLNTNMPIKDIQEKHGFYNDKVFRRMFKEVYGCTPREARK